MTTKELLKQIIEGTAGEYVRYAPVDLIRAIMLMNEIERSEFKDSGGMEDFLKAIRSSVDRLYDDDSIRWTDD